MWHCWHTRRSTLGYHRTSLPPYLHSSDVLTLATRFFLCETRLWNRIPHSLRQPDVTYRQFKKPVKLRLFCWDRLGLTLVQRGWTTSCLLTSVNKIGHECELNSASKSLNYCRKLIQNHTEATIPTKWYHFQRPRVSFKLCFNVILREENGM